MKDFSLLDAWNIAKLLHSRYEPNHSYALGFDKLHKDQMVQIRSVFSKFLTSNLLSEDKWMSVMSLSGFSEEKPHKTALADTYSSLEMLVKQQKNIGQSNPLPLIKKPTEDLNQVHTLAHGPTFIAYLSHSKNVLVANGPEVKVFSKEQTQNALSFTNFSNYPRNPEDRVGLRITVSDLDFMIDNLDLKSFESSTAVINFMRDIAQYYANEFVVLPYISALVGVSFILEFLQDQFV